MTSNRILALLLALFMLFSMIPFVHAAAQEESSTEPPSDNLPEEDAESEETGGETAIPEDTLDDNKDTLDDTNDTTENLEDTETPTEESEEIYTGPPESDTISSLYVGMEDPGEYAVAPLAETPDTYVTTRNNNYMLLRCKDGNIINWHHVDFDQKAPWEDYNLIYCLDFGKAFSSGTGNSGDLDVGFEGSSQNSGPAFWYGLSADQRRTIGLILLYGCPLDLWDEEWGINTSTNKQNPNIGYRAATQALIWEIEAGYREPFGDYTLLNDRWYNDMQGYNLSADGTTDYFLVGYNHIVSKLKQHDTIPSFTSSYMNSAPVHNMTGTSLTLTDANGVLSDYTFTNTNAVTFTKSGNKLTVTANGTIPSTAFSATKDLPKPEDCVYQIFWNGLVLNTYQPQIRIAVPAYDPVPAYFKLQAPNGSIEIQKSVNVSGNLSGWVFDVYTNSACTTLYGTYTTDSNGKISITNVPAGTYYVRERASTNAYWSCDTATKTVTVTAGAASTVKVTNTLRGRIQVTKTTNTGQNLSGWKFQIKNSSGTVVETITTNTNGIATSGYLTPGKYTVTEVGSSDAYWSCDTASKSVTVTGGSTAKLTVSNIHYGKIQVTKATNTGKNLSGWKFQIKNSTGTVVETITTNSNGVATSSNLEPGKYTVTEVGSTDAYWVCDTASKSVTVTAGTMQKLTVTNNHYGKIQITKTTNTGANLSGWKFQIKNSTGTVVETITTNSSGIATSSNLEPGNYTVTELSNNDAYWECDTEAKDIQVVAGTTKKLTVTNANYGKIQIVKTTNTGSNRSGWRFQIKNSAGAVVETITTNSNGVAISSNLEPGKYTVTEVGSSDPYWVCDVSAHSVTVKGSETTSLNVENMHRGRAYITKKTNTGEDISGWIFGIYSDSACKTQIATLTSGFSGITGHIYLEPGTYYWKEIGDSKDRFGSEYWPDESLVQTFTITAGNETALEWTNNHCGKIQFTKKLDTDGPLDGWSYKITDASGNEIEGSPFTTDEQGTFSTGLLEPGTYTVEEILPEDSWYYCKSDNPQTVTVKAGESAEVSFVNALRPGRIEIEKISASGERLAGAKFLLEWSEDGKTWQAVKYHSKEDVVKGYCSSVKLQNGCLVTDNSGIIAFEGLYPTLQYRVTELEAPNGYQLLEKPAFEGTLPNDTIEASLWVINSPLFTLPMTGSNTLALMPIGLVFCAVVCMGALLSLIRRKEA